VYAGSNSACPDPTSSTQAACVAQPVLGSGGPSIGAPSTSNPSKAPVPPGAVLGGAIGGFLVLAVIVSLAIY